MRLTKTSLVTLGIIVLLAVIGAKLDNWMSYSWPLITSVWMILLLVERGMLFTHKPEIQRLVRTPLYLGQTSQIQYIVKNTGRRPIRLRSIEYLPSCMDTKAQLSHWNLATHEKKSQHIEFKVIGTGTITLNKIHAILLGSLGLAWWDRDFSVLQTIRLLPDYRPGDRGVHSGVTDINLHLPMYHFPSITLVINNDQLNQLTVNGLRRIDRYINHGTAIACQAINAHQPVNFVVYDQTPTLVTTGIRTLPELGRLFARINEVKPGTDSSANHRSVLPVLDKLSDSGLLIWYTDFDDAHQVDELARIAKVLKQHCHIVFYDHIASESALLDEDLLQNCRSPYHKLAVMDIKQQWHSARRLLQNSDL